MVRDVIVVCAAATGLTATGAGAAQTFQFTYAPDVGSFVTTTHQVRGNVHYLGFPGLADSAVAEYESLVGATRRIVEEVTGAWVAHQTYDSVRARYRIEGRAWNTMASLTVPLDPVRLLVDHRAVARPMGEAPVYEAVVARGATGSIQVQLPDGPVSPGESWSAAVRLPVVLGLPGDSARVAAVAFDGTGEATLDSLVARGSDTLAYVSVRGRMQPITMATVHPMTGAPATVELEGSTLSSLIWSTGWGMWVGSGSSLLIRGRLDISSGATDVDGRLLADLTARFQIRP